MSNFRTKQARITVAGLAIIIHNYHLLQVSGTHSFYKIIVVTANFNLTFSTAHAVYEKKVSHVGMLILFLSLILSQRGSGKQD